MRTDTVMASGTITVIAEQPKSLLRESSCSQPTIHGTTATILPFAPKSTFLSIDVINRKKLLLTLATTLALTTISCNGGFSKTLLIGSLINKSLLPVAQVPPSIKPSSTGNTVAIKTVDLARMLVKHPPQEHLLTPCASSLHLKSISHAS